MIRIQLLGSMELRAPDGRSIQSVLAQPRRTALLAYLAATTTRGFQRRDTLLGLFWAETETERARRALNQALYALRTALGRDAIVSRGEEVGLDGAAVWSDVAAVDAAMAAGRMDEACELYRGDLLPGFFLSDAPGFEQWLELERARLRRMVADAAWRMADREEAAGRAVAAGHWARRAAALLPDDEPALRRLMTLLARVGDSAGAIAAWDAFVKRLAAEYELEPSPETQALALQLGAAAEARPTPPMAAGLPGGAALPALTTPAVGREADCGALKGLLRHPGNRLVTISGPGGIGKTHLALQAASQAAADFADGARFVSLATVDAPTELAASIAHALGIPLDGEPDPERQLLHALAPRHMLLVLDNFDHLVEGAGLVARLLERAPELRLLVTSREPLNLRAETLWPLAGLRTPEQDCEASPEQYGAIQLFLQAARRTAPDLRLGGSELRWIARICRLVDGMPLAIELAAAWLRVLSCEELCHEIEKSYAFLEAPLRDLPARHRSLRVSFLSSWNRLSAEERAAFSRLAVFRGGFHREAALDVADLNDAMLLGLVDRSLLRRLPAGRFEMLEVLRQFALDGGGAAERDAVRDRHCAFHARLVQRCTPAGAAPWSDASLRSMAEEAANLRAAWQHALRQCRLDELDMMIDGLFAFHDISGWHREGEQAFGDAAAELEREAPEAATQATRVLARLQARQGVFRMRLGEHGGARDLFTRAVVLARAAGDRAETAFSLDRLGVACYNAGSFDEARRCEEEALSIRRELGDDDGIATSLNNLGSLAYALGAYEQARGLCEEALVLQRRLGDTSGIVTSLQNLSWILLLLGREQQAAGLLDEALSVARQSDSRILLARALCSFGNLANARGAHVAAAAHFEEALSTALDCGAMPVALDALVGFAVLLARRGDGQRALQLLATVSAHEAAGRENRASATQLMVDLKADLPPESVEEALQQARRRSLTQLADVVAGAAAALRA